MINPTAVLCNDIRSFERWAKERHILKTHSNRYIDSFGEYYYIVTNKEQTRGINFSRIEVIDGFVDRFDLYTECQNRLINV